jgi:hypothetical protein
VVGCGGAAAAVGEGCFLSCLLVVSARGVVSRLLTMVLMWSGRIGLCCVVGKKEREGSNAGLDGDGYGL